MTNSISPADFMGAAPAPLNGSSPWAARYASDLKRMITDYSDRRPRSVQLHLGPSELGVDCDRQVAGKMAGLPKTNHVTDPWPSFMGTAGHAEMEKVLQWANEHYGLARYIAEQKVTPHPDHPGTADGYDAAEQLVFDWKFLGESTMNKIKASTGPPRKYFVQLLLYGLGYRRMGLPVKRVAIIAMPRTGSTLDGIYVWDHELTPADDELIDRVFAETARRKDYAQLLLGGHVELNQIPNTTNDDDCYFCDFYRPQTAHDGGAGCPGPRKQGG